VQAFRQLPEKRWLVVDEESKGISHEEACTISMEYLDQKT
jgi:hypothetical protein